MGRKANDGRGRLGGRTTGTKNRPRTWADWGVKVLEPIRRNGESLGTNASVLSALIIADAIDRLSVALTGQVEGAPHPADHDGVDELESSTLTSVRV